MKCTIVVPFSQNQKLTDKTIAVAATMRAVGDTCPMSCQYLGNGCYAQKGNVNIAQNRAKSINGDLQVVADKGVKYFRLNVSGDFFWKGRFDNVYFNEVRKFSENNPSIKIWFYSHAVKSFLGMGKSKLGNLFGWLSCDTMKQVKQARKAGWRTARVVNSFDGLKLLKGEFKCRNQLDGTTCVKCGLCFSDNAKLRGVVFRKH